jgi:hypothetical protein
MPRQLRCNTPGSLHVSLRNGQDTLEDIQNQIRPILEFHDNLMKGITEFIEKIPILPALLDQISSQISIFVFSLMVSRITSSYHLSNMSIRGTDAPT